VLDRLAEGGSLPQGGAAPVSEGPASEGGLTREQIERVRRAAVQPLSTAAMARARQAERQKQERVRQAAISWGVAGGALLLTSVLGVLFRQDVARIWPNAASAYAAIGMPVNVVGLEFSQIEVAKTFDGPTPILAVSGAVRNISRDLKKPPVLRFSLRDENGEEVSHWMLELPGTPIQPGGARRFRSTFDNPAVAAADLEATFATPREIAAENAPRVHPAHAKTVAAASADTEADFDDGGPAPEGGPEEPLAPAAATAGAHGGGRDGLAPRLPPEPAAAPRARPHG